MRKLNKCIGIISYLPNDKKIRTKRFNNLKALILKIDKLFNLPILFILQNYTSSELQLIRSSHNIIKTFKDGIGIAHAREELRKLFLQTNYDVIILLDDDSELTGEDANIYLTQIDANPNKIGTMNGPLHKLMSIPRSIYSAYSYDLVNSPENKMGYEDAIFFWTVIKKDLEKMFIFSGTGICDNSLSIEFDENSSWSSSLTKEEQMKMADNTQEIISKLTGFMKRSNKA